MTETPLVSIIIPTYNRAHLIGETLDSILAQTYKNWECIIVDDGSSDNTDAVVGAYVDRDARFCLIKRPEHKIKGASPCRNYGFDNSKGDYIIFLDSDDWLLSHCLMDRVSFMEKNSGIYFSVTPMSVKFRGTEAIRKDLPICNDYLKEFLCSRFHWGIMCTTWRRDALKKIDGFNENYPRLNDPEIHIRAMLKFENYFLVRNNSISDSIYRIDVLKTTKQFSIKYYQSLNLFFNDIVNELETENKHNYVPCLKQYFTSYFKSSYWIRPSENFKLLKLARKRNIINLSEYFLLMFSLTIKWIINKSFNLLNSKLNMAVQKLLRVDK